MQEVVVITGELYQALYVNERKAVESDGGVDAIDALYAVSDLGPFTVRTIEEWNLDEDIDIWEDGFGYPRTVAELDALLDAAE